MGGTVLGHWASLFEQHKPTRNGWKSILHKTVNLVLPRPTNEQQASQIDDTEFDCDFHGAFADFLNNVPLLVDYTKC